MGESIRVLHVDDDPAFVDLSETVLAGREEIRAVESASDADEGLALFREGEFDCIVSDYEMPGLDGLGFFERVREIDPGVPFVLFTGKGSEEIASAAISAGVTDYVQKSAGTEQFDILVNRISNAVERRRAERSSRAWAQAVESANEGIAVVDSDGYYEKVNGPYADMYGTGPEELIGEHWTTTVPQEEVERLEGEVFPSLDESGWSDESIGKRVDGSQYAKYLSLATLPDGGHVCIIRERSGTRATVGSEAQKAELFDVVFEESPDLIDIHDEEGRIVAVNQRTCELLGYDREELIGTPVWEIDRSIDPETAREGWTEMAVGESMRLEREYTASDGSTVPVSVQFVKIDIDGRHWFFVIGRDISERKERERELTRYTETLERLQETTATLLEATTKEEAAEVTLDSIRSVLNYDVAGLWLFEEEQEALVPIAVTRRGTELIEDPPTYTAGGESLSWEVFRSGESMLVDDVREREDRHNPETPIRGELIVPLGEYGVINIGSTRASAFDGEDRTIVELWADTVTTVLARIEQEAELRERETALVRERDRLDEFASFLSHDLRNPLSVAGLRLDLARQESDSENLERVDTALDRMEQLIDDALTLAKEGERIDETVPVDVGAAADTAWENVATGAATMEIACDRTIEADRSRLVRLFENLFRNSVEHGSTNGRRQSDDPVEHGGTDTDGGITVTVGELSDGFFVADDGKGITESDADEVFDSGYTTDSEGTGFGLAIVRRIAEAHGWGVDVTESEDGGARFEITGVDPGE
jgi:PAS domain S-box-containing protein